MTKRVTIAQVAAEAGVSAMTVSNVLNGKPGASTRTRDLVLETARRLGYVPNMAARGLKGMILRQEIHPHDRSSSLRLLRGRPVAPVHRMGRGCHRRGRHG